MLEQLGVRVMGEFRLDGVDLVPLRSRKARLLLKVLALAGGAIVSGDSLVETLWGDDLPEDPAGDLAVLVSRARSVVGAERPQPGRAAVLRSVLADLYTGVAVARGRARTAASTPFNIVLDLRP